MEYLEYWSDGCSEYRGTPKLRVLHYSITPIFPFSPMYRQEREHLGRVENAVQRDEIVIGVLEADIA
jgi:hypothetical protein